jgi:hypothetical protein
MLKLISFFVLFIFCGKTFSQTINNRNYYEFHKGGASMNWLRSSDAVPIIIDELTKNGIRYHTVGVGELFKINDSTRIVATVTFEKGDKEYAFVYEVSHSIPINSKHRDFLTDQSKAYYIQAEKSLNGDVDFMRIDPLPKNILLLKQTCYWFEFDTNNTKFPVDKEVSKSILRQDIQECLKLL